MVNVELLIGVDIVLRFISFGVFLTILLILIKFKPRYHILDPFFVSSMIFGAVSFFLYSLDVIFFLIYGLDLIRIILHTLAYGTLCLFYYSWFRHTNAIMNPKVWGTLHNVIFAIVAGVWASILYFFWSNFVVVNFVDPNYVLSPYAIVTLVSHPSWILGSIVFGYSTYVNRFIYRYTKKTTTKINLMVSTIILGVMVFSEISNSLVTLGIISSITAYLHLVIALGVFVVALFLMIYNYMQGDEHYFYLPFALSDIIIYSENGIPIYTNHLHKENRDKHKLHLITSVFSAITTLFQESLGEDVTLNTISLSEYEILFLPLRENASTLTIITTRGNYFLKQGMMRFKEIIPQALLNKFDGLVIDHHPELHDEITSCLKEAMPFVIFDKQEQ